MLAGIDHLYIGGGWETVSGNVKTENEAKLRLVTVILL